MPSLSTMRRAFAAKDPSFEGLFIVAVKTTGICCRPVCKARTPRPENVEFFPDVRAAVAAGYRPCKRCRPDHRVQAQPPLVTRLLAMLDHQPGQKISTRHLLEADIDPSTARRQFLAHMGTTFARYQRQRRLATAMKLTGPDTTSLTTTSLTTTQLAAGFDSASGFREAAEKLFGVPPAAARHVPILTSAWIPTQLGPMLAIASDNALVLLDFADRRSLETAIVRLRRRFGTAKLPAVITPGQHPILTQTRTQLAEYFAGQRNNFTIPLAPAGSPFELKAWTYLQTIPPGQVHTYGQQAKALGTPTAARAVGHANGMNYIAILIPCHRVCGANGKLTGYGGGLHRKAWLIAHEKTMP